MAKFRYYGEQSIDHVDLGPKIEKGIPIPQAKKRNNSKYHNLYKIIDTWEVGDSVAFKYFKKTTGKARRVSYSLETQAFVSRAKKVGQKIKTVTLPDEGVIRVWRVE
jgi:hypothetical protein